MKIYIIIKQKIFCSIRKITNKLKRMGIRLDVVQTSDFQLYCKQTRFYGSLLYIWVCLEYAQLLALKLCSAFGLVAYFCLYIWFSLHINIYISVLK